MHKSSCLTLLLSAQHNVADSIELSATRATHSGWIYILVWVLIVRRKVATSFDAAKKILPQEFFVSFSENTECNAREPKSLRRKAHGR